MMMKALILLAVIVIGVALLVSSGTVAGAVCIRTIGCLTASAHHSGLDRTTETLVRTP